MAVFSPQKEILTKLEVLALRDPHVLQERATRICGREAGYRGEEQEKGERRKEWWHWKERKQGSNGSSKRQ